MNCQGIICLLLIHHELAVLAFPVAKEAVIVIVDLSVLDVLPIAPLHVALRDSLTA